MKADAYYRIKGAMPCSPGEADTTSNYPKSSLMMLVSAFAGHSHIMALYAEAIAQKYRFFSYGDAMLLRRL